MLYTKILLDASLSKERQIEILQKFYLIEILSKNITLELSKTTTIRYYLFNVIRIIIIVCKEDSIAT